MLSLQSSPSRFRVRVARGFTLVELLVAATLLAVGLLALVGCATAVARLVGDGERRATVAALAARRLEQLHASGCAATGGSGIERGVRERWSVASRGSTARELEDTLHIVGGRALADAFVRGGGWC